MSMPVRAQLVADGASLTIDGVTTNLGAADLWIGYTSGETRLTITNAGGVQNQDGVIGYSDTSDSNEVMVAGAGSWWTNNADLIVGQAGAKNKLTITAGGRVRNAVGVIGYFNGSDNNEVVVTGVGSLWTNSGALAVGNRGPSNKLTIADGAWVTSVGGYVGNGLGSTSSQVVVSGPGSQWMNSGTLDLGRSSSFNSLLIEDGALVLSSASILGINDGSDNNVATVSGTNSVWHVSGEVKVNDNTDNQGNRLRIINGGTVHAGGATIDLLGYGGNFLEIDGGSLYVTNAAGNAQLTTTDTRLQNGTLHVDKLFSKFNSFAFQGGLLRAKNCEFVTQTLNVGNGSTPAHLILDDSPTPHKFNGGLVLANKATLTCNGLIWGGAVTAQGGSAIIPGNGDGPGRMRVNVGVLMQANATLSVRLDGPTAGDDYSQIVSSDFTFQLDSAGGTLLNVELGYIPLVGTQFAIIDMQKDYIFFTFNGLPEGATFTVGRVTMRINYAAGSDKYDTVLTVTDVSPPRTNYVDLSSATPIPPYTNWSTAARDIQSAIDAADVGGTVMVSNGVYSTGGRVSGVAGELLTNRVVIDKVVTVRSVNGPEATTIQGAWDPVTTNGNAAVRCVWMTSDASLVGFTLTKGATRTVDVYDRYGGGLFAESSTAIISNCLIRGNSAKVAGGGVMNGALFDCTLSENVSYTGGGAIDAILNRCILQNNTASYYAGALSSTLTNCVIAGNAATDFAGGTGWSFLYNCLVIGNTAGSFGAGLYFSTANNCTIVENSAADSAGGVYDGTLNNCIVYSNRAAANPNHSLASFTNSCTIPLPAGAGNFANDPQFVDAVNSNFTLAAGSPCRDTGINGIAPAGPDLAGNPRIVNSYVDVGAYEYQGGTGQADYDGDGIGNGDEQIAGTDLTNPTNFFHVASISLNSPATLSFDTVSGRVYAVDYNEDLLPTPQQWFEFTNNIPGTGQSIEIQDPGSATSRSYRVRVQRAP